MRGEGIGNKIILIVMLCAALGLFLYLRPRLFSPEEPPSLLDRIPDSDILGKVDVLDVARETSSMMYYNKIPFRDLTSAEFLLSQGKNFGLDIQKPAYFFANESGEWGAFLSVLDSSKVNGGIRRLTEFAQLSDTIIHKRRLHYLPEFNLYFFYEKDYLMLYHGNKAKQRVGRAMFAKRGEMGELWKKFESIQMFRDEKLVVFGTGKKLRDLGIDYGIFAHDTDSTSFKLKSYIKSSYPLKIKLKEPSLALEEVPGMEKSLNLHFDISEFKKDKKHPFYLWVKKMGKRVSFPVDAFFDAWDGDLSFRQGGTQMIRQEVITTDYDDEFNLVEERTTQMVPVPGFSILFTTNENSQKLISQLFAKGIITKQENRRYRFLFSPPLKMTIMPNYIVSYSSEYQPKFSKGSSCSGIWNYNGTNIEFRIDSLKSHEIYGSMEFPVNRLIRKSKFF